LADVEIYINLLNLSLNLQFVAATTTEASRAGPASPAIVTSGHIIIMEEMVILRVEK
jgi:hypothetical protein